MAKRKKKSEAQNDPSSALVPVNAASQREAAQEQMKALQASIRFPSLIKNDGEYQRVGDALRQVATVKKAIEAKRRSVTRLLDAAKKGIMEWFAPMVKECDRLRDEGDELMANWRRELEAKAEEARKKEEAREAKRLAILRANEKKKLEEAGTREEKNQVRESYREKRRSVQAEQAAIQEGIVTHRPKAAGVAIKKVWRWEQTLPYDQIALEFITMSLNDEAIRREIKLQVDAGRPAPSIRGLRIWQEESSAVGGF